MDTDAALMQAIRKSYKAVSKRKNLEDPIAFVTIDDSDDESEKENDDVIFVGFFPNPKRALLDNNNSTQNRVDDGLEEAPIVDGETHENVEQNLTEMLNVPENGETSKQNEVQTSSLEGPDSPESSKSIKIEKQLDSIKDITVSENNSNVLTAQEKPFKHEKTEAKCTPFLEKNLTRKQLDKLLEEILEWNVDLKTLSQNKFNFEQLRPKKFPLKYNSFEEYVG